MKPCKTHPLSPRYNPSNLCVACKQEGSAQRRIKTKGVVLFGTYDQLIDESPVDDNSELESLFNEPSEGMSYCWTAKVAGNGIMGCPQSVSLAGENVLASPETMTLVLTEAMAMPRPMWKSHHIIVAEKIGIEVVRKAWLVKYPLMTEVTLNILMAGCK